MKNNRLIKITLNFILLVAIIFSVIPFAGCGEPDYKTIVNRITTEKMSANVRVENKCSGLAGYEIMQGSGVIISKSTDSADGINIYLFLTNNHVIVKDNGFPLQEYKVYDYKDNEYNPELLYSSESYDLALMSFYCSEELALIELSESDAAVLGNVFAVGQPQGQHNAVTIGTATGIVPPPLAENGSKLPFNVIMHDAYISKGSSGGMLLDANLKLAGVNYAGSVDEKGNFAYAYAIPVSKVKEFLKLSGVLGNSFSN